MQKESLAEVARNKNVWALLTLAGVIITTALQGTDMTVHDFTTWSVVFNVVANVLASPVKVVTIALAVLSYYCPRPQEDKRIEEEVKKEIEGGN